MTSAITKKNVANAQDMVKLCCFVRHESASNLAAHTKTQPAMLDPYNVNVTNVCARTNHNNLAVPENTEFCLGSFWTR